MVQRITEERPPMEPFKIRPARKDMLIDGNGIMAQIEIGPRLDKDSDSMPIYVAYVSANLDSDLRYFYPELQPIPNQYPELFMVQAPKDMWIQLNDDSYCGSWLMTKAFNDTDTPMSTNIREKALMEQIESMKFTVVVQQLEILRLREENDALRNKADDELVKISLMQRRLRDQQPIIMQPGIEGGQIGNQ